MTPDSLARNWNVAEVDNVGSSGVAVNVTAGGVLSMLHVHVVGCPTPPSGSTG
ncbi:MAG: hypothetical protein H0W94_02990 [Actinobacteria bacterium]|nr:hypothetical protein [Actinomycetota bacterium]